MCASRALIVIGCLAAPLPPSTGALWTMPGSAAPGQTQDCSDTAASLCLDRGAVRGTLTPTEHLLDGLAAALANLIAAMFRRPPINRRSARAAEVDLTGTPAVPMIEFRRSPKRALIAETCHGREG